MASPPNLNARDDFIDAPTLYRSFADPANVVTSAGLVLSVCAFYFFSTRQPEWGVAFCLWALLADHLDGVVARRTPSRSPYLAETGKNLDALADLFSACVAPSAFLLVACNYSIPASIAAGAVILIGALRLSYFNAVSYSWDHVRGVPITYIVPSVAALVILQPLIPAVDLSSALIALFVVLTIGMVSPIRLPKLQGVGYLFIIAYIVIASAVLVERALSTRGSGAPASTLGSGAIESGSIARSDRSVSGVLQ